MKIFEEVKSKVSIVDVARRFGIDLDKSNKALCPFHNEDTPSFSVKAKENIFKCFGCGESGDVITFVAKLKNISLIDAVKLIAEEFGITIENERKEKKSTYKTSIKHTSTLTQKEDIKKYIGACHKNIGLTDYFSKRGLTAETCNRFYLGYDKKENRVVLPYNPAFTYFQTRSVDDKIFFKPPTKIAGAEPLFNAAALAKADPVFIVESPFCAISIAQCGGNAISLCGINNVKKFVKVYAQSKTRPPVIVSLDNDRAGLNASSQLIKEFEGLGAIAMPFNISGDFKDPNELLVANPELLKKNIETALSAIKGIKPSINRDAAITAAELLRMELPETRWFVEDIMPEGLHILAAPSKAGKSWMMMQLAFALAENTEFLGKKTFKTTTIYLALEDSLNRLKDRMCKMKLSPNENVVLKVTAKTLQTGFIEELKEILKTYPNTGLVIIDTLQIIRDAAAKNEGVYSTDYREMRVLKDFAQIYKVTILLVHHLRKMNDADTFNRISGSTGLMGACDAAYTLTKDKRTDDNTILEMIGRDISTQKMTITFNKSNYRWEFVGDAEDQARRKQRSDYENNDIVKTVKKLLELHPHGWQGKIEEFAIESANLFKKPLPFSNNNIAKQINDLDVLLAADGITHKKPAGGGRKGRIHGFYLTKNLYSQIYFESS